MLTAGLSMFAALAAQAGQAAAPADLRGGLPFQRAYANWALACEDPRFRGHTIRFELALDPDGRIVEGPTLIRPNDNPDWRQAAESARQALLRSAPFDVPADFAGGKYRPTFNTTRACALMAEADED